jgi:GMP synthase-like glutamine amidotransferase
MQNNNLQENIRERFPQTLSCYTDHGTFTYKLGDCTREGDILRAAYNGSTYEKTGNPLDDGEPDFIGLDIHFMSQNNQLKTNVIITYGDAVVSEFNMLPPNKVKVGHYEGIDSMASPETHFGFNDNSLRDIVKLFNSFDKSYKFTTNEFKFIDKYLDSYTHNESVNLMPLSHKQTLMLIDNTKPPKHRFISKVEDWLRSRGINYVKVSSLEEGINLENKANIVGIIMSGSDYNVDDSPQKQKLFRWAITNFNCPTLAICYAAQNMMRHYGAKLYRGDTMHDNLEFTQFKDHDLLNGVDCSNHQFSFSFKDFITEAPAGFEEIAKVGKRVVFAANDKKKEWALFFHPEAMEYTQKVLDNFMRMIHPAQSEQEKILKGKFESRILDWKGFLRM